MTTNSRGHHGVESGEAGGWYLQRSNKGHVEPERQAVDEARLCHLEHKRDFHSARKQERKEETLGRLFFFSLSDISGNIHRVFSFSLNKLHFSFGGKILTVWLMVGWQCTFENVASCLKSSRTTLLCCNDPECHWVSVASGAGFDYWRGGWPRTQVTTILQEAKTWAAADPLHSCSSGRAIQVPKTWSG